MSMLEESPGALRTFLDRFADALLAPESARVAPTSSPSNIAALVSQPGFAVYRNTVLKGCIDALEANYPAVSKLVGSDWFRAAALVYVRLHLPRQPSLLHYGSGFAEFLAQFGPAKALPYLADVAQLDRFWTEAHVARDEAPVAAAAITRLTPLELSRVVLRPHASARWAWFDSGPIVTLWERNRAESSPGADPRAADTDLDWQAEGVLILRPRAAVGWIRMGKAGCAFLDACAAGNPLGDAAMAALAANPGADLAALTAKAFDAGAFGELSIVAETTLESDG